MDATWEEVTAAEVAVGDRVRLRGTELTVARVEDGFLGRPGMLAFVEDTPDRWLKVPAPHDAAVEVLRER